MAIFKKEKTEEKNVKEDTHIKNTEAKKAAFVSIGRNGELENVLIRPHITEKASTLAENNIYVFEVGKRARKTAVKAAVKEIYKVNPMKINIVNSPSKRVFSKGIKGVKSGKKKAMVFLKKGDSIEVV
jgi:large subunit ribosomal protein L23